MAIGAMYLKLTGVTGESLVDNHVGEIELMSWDWGLLATIPTGDSLSPVTAIEEFKLIKPVDRATPTLIQFCDCQKLINSATLTVTKSGGDESLPYFTIGMNKVRITKVDVRVGKAGEGAKEHELIEHVHLSCETMTISYTPQSDEGGQESGSISYTTHPN